MLKKLSSLEADVEKLKNKPTVTAKTPVVCRVCNKEGHLSFGCRDGQDVECSRCHAKGHLANSCRSKKKPLNRQ